MKEAIKNFVVILVLLASPALFAQDNEGIDIDVKGGSARVLTAVAVPDAIHDGASKGVAKTVQDVLRRDLDLSGFFKVLPSDSFFFDPSKEPMGTINYQNWSNVGAQALVKSSVSTVDGKVTLDLRLFVVDKGVQAKIKWKGKAGSKDKVRDEVHAFVNAVIEYYTGKAGIFGTKIAFVGKSKGGKKQIFVMDMDGSNVGRVTKNRSINLLPSWGAGKIYYTSYAHDNPDLWVSSGGKQKKLSKRRGINTGASFCKGKVAVTMSMGGENTDIYLIDAATGKMIKRLTNHWSIDTSPTWKSDCSKIAFVSGRSGSPQVYVMNGDGSDQKRLTFKGTYNTSPSWSPKEDLIAFTARDERARFDVFTVDIEGRIDRITQDQGNNEDPSFSPDGRYLVFSSDRGGKGKRLWITTSDGEIQRLITKSGGGHTAPDWEK